MKHQVAALSTGTSQYSSTPIDRSSTRIAIALTCALVAFLAVGVGLAIPVPTTSKIYEDSFDVDGVDPYLLINGSNVFTTANGRNATDGAAVTISTSAASFYMTEISRTHDGYLQFYYNLGNISIPTGSSTGIAGRSIFIATLRGTTGGNLVGLRVYEDGGTFKGYLQYTEPDGSWVQDFGGAFTIPTGWNKLVIGFRVDDFVAVWLNGVEKSRVTGVDHRDIYATRAEFGDIAGHSNQTPTGTMRYDDLEWRQLKIDDLWVDDTGGNDSNDGLTQVNAFQTIREASDWAGPGTTVHIMPGIYREQLLPAVDGTLGQPTLYKAENGKDTVFMRGSVPSSDYTWTQMVSNTIGLPAGTPLSRVWWTEISGFDIPYGPRYVTHLSTASAVKADVTRLWHAREPDYRVDTYWKDHEFWWSADGGHKAATCYPPTDPDPSDCDDNQRAKFQLTDATNDGGEIEDGNLTTLGDMTGARIFALDSIQGNVRTMSLLTNHDTVAGTITIADSFEHPGTVNGGAFGWGTKYFLHDHPGLIDTPGEWWYDVSTERMYIYPPQNSDPAGQNIEIAVLDNIAHLGRRSYIHLVDLNMEFAVAAIMKQSYVLNDAPHGNALIGTSLRHSIRGVEVNQTSDTSVTMTDGFLIEDCEISHTDGQGVLMFGNWLTSDDPSTFVEPPYTNITIKDSYIHHNGFLVDFGNGSAVQINRADNVLMENNVFEQTAQSGVFFDRSVIDSPNEYGFSDSEILTGDIVFRDNLIQDACLQSADCGGLRFWGRPPDSHVFRDVLIYNNTIRNVFAHSYVSVQRQKWDLASQSGMSGSGIYFDTASGAHLYRNKVYNTPLASFRTTKNWRDGKFVFFNNVGANAAFGFYADVKGLDTHDPVGVMIKNNILANMEGFGYVFFDPDAVMPNVDIDRNLYFDPGWNEWHVSLNPDAFFKSGIMAIWEKVPNDYYQTITEMQTAGYSSFGLEGPPGFSYYQPSDHKVHDCSTVDFHLAAGSSAIDAGTTFLENGLLSLLLNNGITDQSMVNGRWDIGAYEYQAHADFDSTRGGSSADNFQGIGRSMDQGYFLAGSTESIGNGMADAWSVKLDVDNNLVWSERYGGTADDEFRALAPTEDGGVINAGQLSSFSRGGTDGYMVKLDAEGNKDWSFLYGGGQDDVFNAVIETCDGFVAAGGTSTYCKSGTGSCGWLNKTDKSGIRIWSQTRGGQGDDIVHDIIQTKDGNYLMVGGMYIPPGNPWGNQDTWDAWVIKFDPDGNKVWSKVIGLAGDEILKSVVEDADGNLWAVGYTTSFRPDKQGTLIKMDSNGNRLLWTGYGGADTDEFFSIYHDGTDFVAVGRSDSYTVPGVKEGFDAWSLKFDDTGSSLWNKTFGGTSDEELFDVTQSHNSGTAFAGWVESFGAGLADGWLKIVDSSGS